MKKLLALAGIGSTVSLPKSGPAQKELESLSDVEKACLEAMREDFNRGIVVIDPKDDEGNALEMKVNSYQAALNRDKTAGQSWETVQERLLANEATLLKKAVELSKLTGDQEGKGACLVGVYENGELAIRQRSQEIVNARWTKDWQDEQSEKGELRLLFHPEAMAQITGRWAKPVEILRALTAAGYHVPEHAPLFKKIGLVAASDAVTGADYVAGPNRNECREAMLADNVDDNGRMRVVAFYPFYGSTGVSSTEDGTQYYNRNDNCGAVLWLRG